MKRKFIFIIAALVLVFAAVYTVNAQSDTKVYITFGRYEQDNNINNGPEDIEWQVITIENSRALLLSRYGLDTKPYNEVRTSTTWETSTLRKWLNNDFYNNAFTAAERSKMLYLQIQNKDNPKYGTPGGNDTADHIFLMSVNDVLHYLPDASMRKCEATPYAKAHKAEVYSNGNSWWWLRTPGAKEGAVHIYSDGEIYYEGGYVNNISDVVRPVIWVDWDKM